MRVTLLDLPLARSVVVAATVGVAMIGCQSPDQFFRDGGANSTGTGGRGGTGGTISGTGGSPTGRAGSQGQGTGGSPGTGGTVGPGTGGTGGSMMQACPSCRIRITYLCRGSDTNQASLTIRIVNAGAVTVPLANLTVRYWYTPEPTAPAQKAECDYAVLGCANIVMTTGTQAGAGGYVELSFGATAPPLDSFATSGDIQVRIHNEPYSTFDQTNDYSFDCSGNDGGAGAPVETTKITAYVGGTLSWGTEPGGTPTPDGGP